MNPAPESPYDVIAPVYDRYWGAAFAAQATKVVEDHLARRLPEGASVLDLCCGSGLLLRELSALGYECFGVDESAGMLRIAAQKAPGAVLQRADMAEFRWDRTFDAVTCLFNSLSHACSGEHLRATLKQVRRHLRSGGLFLFDYVPREAFASRWTSTEEIQVDGRRHEVKYEFDPERGLATCSVGGSFTIRQFPFETSAIEAALRAAGLTALSDMPILGRDLSGGRRLMLATPQFAEK